VNFGNTRAGRQILQEVKMDWKEIYRVLDQVFDTERCLDRLREIWERDKWNDYSRYEDTANYCLDSMKAAGLKDTETLYLKADGKTCYGDWVIPLAWKAERGVLCYADGEVIADYQKNPCSLSMYSPSTDGVVEGEVVDVTGMDEFPSDGSLKGKILLSDRPNAAIARKAYNAGAIGVLSDQVPLHEGIRDSRKELYDDCVWQGMSWKRPTVFGFKLTPRQGDRLREQLKKASVRLTADIKTQFYEGVNNTVSGALMGIDPSLPEVFSYAHLYEPGANDNASGSAALLELAACFEEAIARGLLPRPKRTIRFAMGGECTGSMGYMLAHPQRKMLCGGVVDMIGTESIDRTQLSLRYDPIANWSYADAALDLSVRLYGEYKNVKNDFKSMYFADELGTDNIIADPIFNTPSVALVASPALSYHSSFDTPERIQPEILKRNSLILGVYLYGLADADAETCSMLERELKARLIRENASQLHPRKKRHNEEAFFRARYSLRRIDGTLDYEKPVEEALPMPEYAAERGNDVPERLVKGCLTLHGRPELKNPPYCVAWNGKMNVPLFWIDGKRSLWQIAVQTALELNLCSDEEIREKFEELVAYFDFLAEQRYLAWK